MRRREHYDRVVVWDRLARYPQLRHVTEVPKVTGLTLHRSLRAVGMNAERGVAAMTALYRRTGHRPRVHASTVSLAGWKLREGDLVACSVHLGEAEARAFVETWRTLVLPGTRSFESRDPGRVATVAGSVRGGVSLPISDPRLFPALEPLYERLNPRCSRPGLRRQIERAGSGPGSRDPQVVRSRLTGRGFPFRR